jgi:hypothetical protein
MAVLEKELKKDVPDPLHTILENKQERDVQLKNLFRGKGKQLQLSPQLVQVS